MEGPGRAPMPLAGAGMREVTWEAETNRGAVRASMGIPPVEWRPGE